MPSTRKCSPTSATTCSVREHRQRRDRPHRRAPGAVPPLRHRHSRQPVAGNGRTLRVGRRRVPSRGGGRDQESGDVRPTVDERRPTRRARDLPQPAAGVPSKPLAGVPTPHATSRRRSGRAGWPRAALAWRTELSCPYPGTEGSLRSRSDDQLEQSEGADSDRDADRGVSVVAEADRHREELVERHVDHRAGGERQETTSAPGNTLTPTSPITAPTGPRLPMPPRPRRGSVCDRS